MKPTLGMVVAMASEARLLLGRGSWHRIEGRLVRSLPLEDGTGLIAARAGLGAENAYAAASWLVSQGVSALIGAGLAGGLCPGLKAGQLVVAKSILTLIDCGKCRKPWMPDPAGVAHARAALASEGVSVACGTLVTAPEAVLTVAGKESLFRQTRALAVDMESAGIARAAEENHLPFFIMRAICDPAEEAVPRALSDCLDENGKVRPATLLFNLAARPTLVPDMVRMGRCFATAGHSLQRGWRIQMRGALPQLLTSAPAAG